MLIKQFNIYEGDELVFTGTAQEIAEKYIVNTSMIYMFCKSGLLLLGQYKVTPAEDREMNPQKKEVVEKKKTKHELKLEYLIRHFTIYGNVYCNTDGSEYKKELNDLGIYFTSRKAMEKGYILEKQR